MHKNKVNKVNKVKKYYFPSKAEHLFKNDNNVLPTTKLYHVAGELDQHKQKIYRDDFGNKWYEFRWYNTLLHCPSHNVKLVNYDQLESSEDLSFDISYASSEMIISKKYLIQDSIGNITIQTLAFKEGSFNFRDVHRSNHWQHFVSDILPAIIYCSC